MFRTYQLTVVITLAAATALMFGISPETTTQPEQQSSLPTGHPAVSMPEKPNASAPADPADVQTIDAIVDAYYASVSGAKGQKRDWNRFLSLFSPDARFIVVRKVDEKMVPLSLSPIEFVDSNRTYFERGGYFEKDIHREIDTFGHIAQVFSTYASRRAKEDPEPYSRGINSIQLMNTGDRWWITSIMWDHEQPETNPIPEAYLTNTEE